MFLFEEPDWFFGEFVFLDFDDDESSHWFYLLSISLILGASGTLGSFCSFLILLIGFISYI